MEALVGSRSVFLLFGAGSVGFGPPAWGPPLAACAFLSFSTLRFAASCARSVFATSLFSIIQLFLSLGMHNFLLLPGVGLPNPPPSDDAGVCLLFLTELCPGLFSLLPLSARDTACMEVLLTKRVLLPQWVLRPIRVIGPNSSSRGLAALLSKICQDGLICLGHLLDLLFGPQLLFLTSPW